MGGAEAGTPATQLVRKSPHEQLLDFCRDCFSLRYFFYLFFLVSRARVASSRRYSAMGRAGVPEQTTTRATSSQSAPIATPPATMHPGPMRLRAPIRAPAPTTASASIDAV